MNKEETSSGTYTRGPNWLLLAAVSLGAVAFAILLVSVWAFVAPTGRVIGRVVEGKTSFLGVALVVTVGLGVLWLTNAVVRRCLDTIANFWFKVEEHRKNRDLPAHFTDGRFTKIGWGDGIKTVICEYGMMEHAPGDKSSVLPIPPEVVTSLHRQIETLHAEDLLVGLMKAGLLTKAGLEMFRLVVESRTSANMINVTPDQVIEPAQNDQDDGR